MPKARKHQISLSETPFYHCVSRCVRRAFLCGFDKFTNKSFEHRRALIEARLFFLSSFYTIDIAAFAIMSNHLHLVLKVDQGKANNLITKHVLERWHSMHYGTQLTRKYCQENTLTEQELSTVKATCEVYRQRLCSISWFMKDLNEYIARIANAEDECTGRFWEGRFSCHALLDDSALLSCMAYVDLNPVRAGIAKSVDGSDHTSIQLRVSAARKGKQPDKLLKFVGGESLHKEIGINFTLNDYLKLIDMTGRCIRDDKVAFIDESELPILTRLGISRANWLKLSSKFEMLFHGSVGNVESLDKHIEFRKHKRRPNFANSQKLFA